MEAGTNKDEATFF